MIPSLRHTLFSLGLIGGALCAHAQNYVTAQLLQNPGAETTFAGSWSPVSGVGFIRDTGTFDPGYNPHSGSYQFVAGASAGAAGTLAQTVSLTGLANAILDLVDQGLIEAEVSYWFQNYFQGGTPDGSRVTLQFFDSSSASLGSYATALQNAAHGGSHSWANYATSVDLPAGTRSIIYNLEGIRGSNGGGDIDAFTDDHSLRLVAVPEPGTYALCAGLAALGLVWRRRRRAHAGP